MIGRREPASLQVRRLLLQLLCQILNLLFFAAQVEMHLLRARPQPSVLIFRYIILDFQVSVHVLYFISVIFLEIHRSLVDFLQCTLGRRALHLVDQLVAARNNARSKAVSLSFARSCAWQCRRESSAREQNVTRPVVVDDLLDHLAPVAFAA